MLNDVTDLKSNNDYLPLLLFPSRVQKSFPLPLFFLLHVVIFAHGSTKLVRIGRRHLEIKLSLKSKIPSVMFKTSTQKPLLGICSAVFEIRIFTFGLDKYLECPMSGPWGRLITEKKAWPFAGNRVPFAEIPKRPGERACSENPPHSLTRCTRVKSKRAGRYT